MSGLPSEVYLDSNYVRAYINFDTWKHKAFIDSHPSSNNSKISETNYRIIGFYVFNKKNEEFKFIEFKDWKNIH